MLLLHYCTVIEIRFMRKNWRCLYLAGDFKPARFLPLSRSHLRLAVPAILGGLTEPMPPQEAVGRIREIGYLPVRAGELSVPDAGGSFGPVIRFAPATLSLPDGPNGSERTSSPPIPNPTLPVREEVSIEMDIRFSMSRDCR